MVNRSNSDRLRGFDVVWVSLVQTSNNFFCISRFSAPPKWLRNFFSGFMGKLLCLGNYYHQVKLWIECTTFLILLSPGVRDPSKIGGRVGWHSRFSRMWTNRERFVNSRTGGQWDHEGLALGGCWYWEVLLSNVLSSFCFCQWFLYLIYFYDVFLSNWYYAIK